MNCPIKARDALAPGKLQGGWRHTGNWPISRQKALSHPEIQAEKKRNAGEDTPNEAEDEAEDGPVNHDYVTAIRRSGMNREYDLKLRKVANTIEDLRATVILQDQEIAGLKAQIEALTKSKTRRKIPDPNARFQKICETIDAGGDPNEASDQVHIASNQGVGDEDRVEGSPEDPDEGEDEAGPSEAPRTRSGRATRTPAIYRE